MKNISILLSAGVGAASAFTGQLLAKPEAPRLKFGVVSDVHIRENWARDRSAAGDTYYFRRTLEYFKTNSVDGVVIAGDIADTGRDEELMEAAKAWFEVFPEGSEVVKLFVSGNHDWSLHKDKDKMKELWERAWKEPYSSLWHKEVKGYHFIGANWECAASKALAGWLEENGKLVRGDKPFFYIQHPHPKETCNGPYAWGRDGGIVTKTLSAWTNAVSFSGHSHHSHTDERSIWQGAFTSVNTASLRYGAHPDDGGLPGRGYENGVTRTDDKLMARYDVLDTKTGLLVEVYDDRIVYNRLDFQNGCELAPAWVQPLPMRADAPAMGFTERAAREIPPAFAADAGVTVSNITVKVKDSDVAALEVRFPAALASATRPFTYEITITGAEQKLVREVLAEGFDQHGGHPRVKADSRVPLVKEQIPAGDCTVEVRPVSSLGVKGKPIAATMQGTPGL